MSGINPTESTLSLLKFNDKNQWGRESIANSPFVWENLATKDGGYYGNIYDLTVDHIGDSFTDISGGLGSKYISRTKGKILKEYSCIYTKLPNTSYASMTVEFWVYLGFNPINTTEKGTLLNYNYFMTDYFPTGAGLFELNVHSAINGKRVFNAGGANSIYSVDEYHWMTYNTSTYKQWAWPLLIYLAYSAVTKKFMYRVPNNIEVVETSGGTKGGRLVQSYKHYETLGVYPPNHWYHIAITMTSSSVCLFINGKKAGTGLSISNSSSGSTSGISYQNRLQFMQTSDYHFSIGNRMTPSYTLSRDEQLAFNNTLSKNYSPFRFWNWNGGNDPNVFAPQYDQIYYIDDVRISNGVIYTGNFRPPGFPGIQLLNNNDKIYAYDDSTYSFTLITDKWSTRTDAEKKATVDSIAFIDLSLEDIQSVTNIGDNPTIEVYRDSNEEVTCEMPVNMYETIVEPSTLIPLYSEEKDINKIEFESSLSEDSYIKVLITDSINSGAQEYKTYNFTTNDWEICDITDISTNGIDIDEVKNIPSSKLMELGYNIGFAYFLHLEPYKSDCEINKIDIELTMSNAWKHCNQLKANYEYPMFNRLKVIFYEDGKYKVNYMDKP